MASDGLLLLLLLLLLLPDKICFPIFYKIANNLLYNGYRGSMLEVNLPERDPGYPTLVQH